MSSNAVETKEESNLEFEKARILKEQKVDVFCIDSIGNYLIGLSLYIYRPGKSYHSTSRFIQEFPK